MSTPIEVVLVWEGIGDLHRGFFSDPSLITNLGLDLAGHVAERPNILIRHDGENFVGWVRMKLLPGTLLAPVRVRDDVVFLQDLAPITTALASYRSGVAARFDFRIESFHVELESVRGAKACVLRLAGRPPPDGRLISPCVEINGEPRCGEALEQGVRFPPSVVRDLESCLDPRG